MDAKKRICDICDYEAKSEKRLAEHYSCVHAKQKLHKCHVCSKEYGYRSGLQSHIRENHDFDFNGYPCDKCAHLAENRNSLEYHKKKIHNSGMKKQFSCDTCGKSYPSRMSLTCHIRSVHKGIRHTCETCGTTITQKSSLLKHFRIIMVKNPKRSTSVNCVKKYLAQRGKEMVEL